MADNADKSNGSFRDTSTLFPSISTVKERQDRALQIAMQFLSEHGYQSSLQMLEEESGVEYNPEFLPEASLYIRALDLLEDAHIASSADQATIERKQIEEALIKGAGKDSKFASKQINIIEQVHSSNIISARYSSDPSSDLVFSGGADRSLRVTNAKTKELVSKFDYAFSAPILSIDVNPVRPELLLVSCMNGSHYVVNHTNAESPVLQKFHEHKKYVVRIKWNPLGTHFITACHDNSVRVYGPKAENEWECIKDFTFVNNVECVEFLQQTTYFVVAVREDNYLHVFDLSTLKPAGKYNMNANGDDHVSFTAMDLSSSHDGKLLQVATDRHRVIVFRALSSAQVRNLYGAVNDNYSNPRTAWSLSDKHVYCSSQQDFSVVCWDLGTQKTVSTLLGHGKIVRDLHHHPTREEVLTASFDQSLRMWGPVLAE